MSAAEMIAPRIFGAGDVPAAEWYFAQPLFDLTDFEAKMCRWCLAVQSPAHLRRNIAGTLPYCRDLDACEARLNARLDAFLTRIRTQEVAA